MKNFFFPKFLLCVLFVFVLAACQSIPAPLPDADIVYQVALLNDRYQLGFVNADGTNPTLVDTDNYVIHPTWLNNKQDGLYGIARHGQSLVFGVPAYWDSKGYGTPTCAHWFNAYQVEPFSDTNLSQVWVASAWGIDLVDLENCHTIKTLRDDSRQGGINVMGISYRPSENVMVFGVEQQQMAGNLYRLVKINTITGLQDDLGSGTNPRLSPDGKQISYINREGIYLCNSDGSNPRLLLQAWVGLEEYGSSIDATYPVWSPDGEWLVYHRCSKTSCANLFDYTIYRINVLTGIEEKIIEGGIYPSWK